MGARRRGRESALQMLYCIDLAGAEVDDVERDHWRYLASSVEGRDFAGSLFHGVMDNLEAIDATIARVSQHWRVTRMPMVDRNVLRMAAFELGHLEDVPRRVTLNEAVDLAKRYSGEGSPGFVNGVLARIADEVKKD
jgi:N utilization substance protein B